MDILTEANRIARETKENARSKRKKKSRIEKVKIGETRMTFEEAVAFLYTVEELLKPYRHDEKRCAESLRMTVYEFREYRWLAKQTIRYHRNDPKVTEYPHIDRHILIKSR